MAFGYSNGVVRRAIDEISEVLRDEVDITKSALGQVNAMIAKIKAMDDPFEYADSLGCLKDSKRILGWKIMGLNQRIKDTEGEIKTFEDHLDIMDATINSDLGIVSSMFDCSLLGVCQMKFVFHMYRLFQKKCSRILPE
nr:hypothetical protein [Tanacetum cinerariifolium]